MPHVRVLPILPGKTEECRQFIRELLTTQRQTFGESQIAEGISEEHFFIQSDPQGDYLIVYNDGDTLKREHIRQVRQRSEHPFDTWYKERFRAIHGVNLDQPSIGARIEHVGSWAPQKRCDS